MFWICVTQSAVGIWMGSLILCGIFLESDVSFAHCQFAAGNGWKIGIAYLAVLAVYGGWLAEEPLNIRLPAIVSVTIGLVFPFALQATLVALL